VTEKRGLTGGRPLGCRLTAHVWRQRGTVLLGAQCTKGAALKAPIYPAVSTLPSQLALPLLVPYPDSKTVCVAAAAAPAGLLPCLPALLPPLSLLSVGLPPPTIHLWVPVKDIGGMMSLAVVVLLVDLLESTSIARALARCGAGALFSCLECCCCLLALCVANCLVLIRWPGRWCRIVRESAFLIHPMQGNSKPAGDSCTESVASTPGVS
jgi:hypothetical protein